MRAPTASRLDPRAAIGPIVAMTVLLAMLAVWLRAGLTLGEAARFGAYELVYVFLPGRVLYGFLQPQTASPLPRLRRVVFSFALGQVVEVLAFALTASVGARGLFAFYPLALLLPTAAWWMRQRARRQTGASDGPSRAPQLGRGSLDRWSLGVGAVCLLALVYLVLVYFVSMPLPTGLLHFTYEHDYVFHLGLAGEALHHWPLENPNVVGAPLNYHWFSYLHVAGISQVTGMSLPTVYFGLFVAPLLLLLLCEVALAGTTLGGAMWAGPIAAFMLIFIGEIDLSMPEPSPFLEVMPIYLRNSPGFLFGATIFVPLMLVICDTLQTEKPSVKQWMLIALLSIGCAGGDGATMPLIVGGIGGYIVYRWLTARRIDRQALVALGLTGLILLLATLVLYAGGTVGLTFTFPASVQVSPPFTYLLPSVPGGWHGAYWALATILLMPPLFAASLVGLFWLPRRLTALRAQEVMPLAIFVCGALAFAFLYQESGSQEYFPMYGVMAAIPISAGGLVRLLSRWRGAAPSSILLALAFAGLCVTVFTAMVFNHRLGASPYPGPRFERTYGILVAFLAGLLVWVWRSPAPLRKRRSLYPVIVVLAAAVVNIPTDYRARLTRIWTNETVQVAREPGLTPDLYDGLTWIREHTSDDAVLAVDNLRTSKTRKFAPLYFYVAAFSERQTFLQGWEYSTRGASLGFTAVGQLKVQPFPERLHLENQVFYRASRPALRELERRYRVTHLVVYKSNGRVTPRLRRIARQVYANPALAVYAVGPS